MKIGDEVYIHGYIDEIRKDIVIIRNEGGYFGAVKDEIVQEPYYKDLAKSYERNINKLTKAIAEQKSKTGHWINDEDTIGCYYCSECGGYVASYDDAYCKYCGAKMEG